MTEARCDTTDLIVGQCAHCKPSYDVAAPVVTRTMTARYTAPCPGCERRIYQDELIHLVDGEWICNHCISNP